MNNTEHLTLTQAEIDMIRMSVGRAPSQLVLDHRGEGIAQVTVPAQWIDCLLATIDHGKRPDVQAA